MPTRLQYEGSILEVLSQDDESVHGLPIPSTTTAVGTTTTLLDSRLGRGSKESRAYQGRLVKLAEDVAGAYTAAKTISGAHTISQTTITVAPDATGINAGDVLVLNSSEKVLVNSISGAVLTVTRGYAGTTAAAYSGGESVQYAFLGAISGVDIGGFAEPATLTVSPAFGVAVPQGLDWLLYPRGWSPDTVVAAINEVLRETEGPHLWFPSIIDDADLDANDLTKWPAVGTPTTRTFVTTAVNALFGERALRIVTDALDEGAESLGAEVTEQESLMVSVFVQVLTGSCKVVLRNATAGSDIKSVTVDEQLYTEVRFQEPVPDNCEQITVRFLSATAASEFFVSAPVIVQPTTGRTYMPPSWFTREEQYYESLYLPWGRPSEVNQSFIALSERSQKAPNVTFLQATRGLNPLLVELSASTIDPQALVVQRAFSELAGDTASSNAERDYVRSKVLANLFAARSDKRFGFWERRAGKLARIFRYGGRRLRLSESPQIALV